MKYYPLKTDHIYESVLWLHNKYPKYTIAINRDTVTGIVFKFDNEIDQ